MQPVQSIDSLTPSDLLDISQRVTSLIVEVGDLFNGLLDTAWGEKRVVAYINALVEDASEVDWARFHWFERAYMAMDPSQYPLPPEHSSHHGKAYFDADEFLTELLLSQQEHEGGAFVPRVIESIDLRQASEIAERHHDAIHDIAAMQSSLQREAAQAANMISAELQCGIDVKQSHDLEPTSEEGGKTFFMSDLLKEYGDISSPTLNKYIELSKVRKTKIGERDRRFTLAERADIATAVAARGSGTLSKIANQILVESQVKSKD